MYCMCPSWLCAIAWLLIIIIVEQVNLLFHAERYLSTGKFLLKHRPKCCKCLNCPINLKLDPDPIILFLADCWRYLRMKWSGSQKKETNEKMESYKKVRLYLWFILWISLGSIAASASYITILTNVTALSPHKGLESHDFLIQKRNDKSTHVTI